MSEYWKSTPKYWCKYCNLYVRDTKIDRAQHEATGKHQGGIQRNLREIHRQQDRDKREGDRAKNEVARLKGIVEGKQDVDVGQAKKPTAAAAAAAAAPRSAAPARPATLEERKLQMEQLAAMGVAVPEQYRPELALVGDWQTISRTVDPTEDEYTAGSGSAHSRGVHKRKAGDSDEEAEVETAAAKTRKGAWGSRLKTMTSSKSGPVDFDALLSSSKPPKAEEGLDGAVKKEEGDDTPQSTLKDEDDVQQPAVKDEDMPRGVVVKKEEPEAPEEPRPLAPASDDVTAAPVVFKKRKSKAAKAS